MQNLSATSQAILDQMTAYHAERLAIFERSHALEKSRRDRRLPASIAKAFEQMAGGGLEGAEQEWAQETAKLCPVLQVPGFSGVTGRHSLFVPWGAVTRDLNAAVDGAGGYLVAGTDVLPAKDILRPWSVMARAGITIEEGLRGDNVLPRTSANVPVTWMSSETAAATPSAPTIAATVMTPKIAIGVIAASRNFMRQALDPERYIRRELLKTAGSVVDTAVLQGAGSGGEPLGVLNTIGLSTQSGTTLARAGVLTMKKNAADANAAEETIAFIGTPAVQQLLEGRSNEAGGGSFVWEDRKIAGCAAFASTTMPAATLLSGPMSEIFLGLWSTGFVLEINPFDPTGFKTGVIQARIVVACDVALGCAPAAFTKATTIT